MSVIGLLHPGEMGAAIGATLVDQGHEVLWVAEGRSAATVRRAVAARLTDAGTLAELAGHAELILSVCPPHAAVQTARSLPGFEGLYIDANAISPDTARSIGASQARFVDGGIVGPPPARAGSTRLYLSGAEAAGAAEVFSGTTVDARVVSAEIGGASALKMAYAAYTKGTDALLLAIRAVARAEHVEPALLEEWAMSQPALEERCIRAAQSALGKGWRWVAEMEEIADTFAAAGLPPGFHTAAAEIYGRSPRASADSDAPLETVLTALLRTGEASDPGC